MMKTVLLGLCIVTAFLATACGGWDVKTDYDPDITFSTLKTYWISDHTKIPNDILAKEDIVRKRVVNAIEAELNERGLTKATDEASADLTVLTYAGVKEMVNYSTIGYSYGGYWGYGAPGMYSTQVVENRYSEGTLHIDMICSIRRRRCLHGADKLPVLCSKHAILKNVKPSSTKWLEPS